MKRTIIKYSIILFVTMMLLSACTQSAMTQKVTFDYNYEGSIPTIVTVEANQMASAFTPYRESYVFAGWYESKTTEVPVDIFHQTITTDVTVYAKWISSEKEMYSITFEMDQEGGSSLEVYVEKEQKVYSPKLEKEGYSLSWEVMNTPFDFDTPVTNDLVLKAVWTKCEVTVNFVDYYGNKIKEVDVPYGSDATLVAPNEEEFSFVPDKDAYSFEGWEEEIESVKDNMTIHAKYEYQAENDDSFIFTPVNQGYMLEIDYDVYASMNDVLVLPKYHDGLPVIYGGLSTEFGVGTYFTPNVKKVYVPSTYRNGIRLYGDKIVNTLYFEDGVEEINIDDLGDCTSLKFLHLPKSMFYISPFLFGYKTYQNPEGLEITIEEGNRYYKVVDNSIYDKDVTSLIYAARGESEFVLPSTVRSLPIRAFANSYNLEHIIISGPVDAFSPEMMSGCFQFQGFVFENDSYVKAIYGYGTYEENGVRFESSQSPLASYSFGVESIVLPEGLEIIGNDAFKGVNVKHITLPKTVRVVYDSSFTGNSFETITFGDSDQASEDGELSNNGRIRIQDNCVFRVNTLGDTMIGFPGNYNEVAGYGEYGEPIMEAYVMPDRVTELVPSLFQCNYQVQEVYLSQRLTDIPEDCFAESNIKSVHVSSGLKHISTGAFRLCYSLNSIDLENSSVEKIEEKAFTDTQLPSLSFPKTLVSIVFPNFYCGGFMGESAYPNGKLMNYEVAEENLFFQAIDGVLFSKNGETLISFPNGRGIHLSDWEYDASKDYKYEVPNGVKTIGAYSFSLCMVNQVVLPDTIEMIEDYGFLGCSELNTLTFSGRLPYLGGVSCFTFVHNTKVTIDAQDAEKAFYALSDLGDISAATGNTTYSFVTPDYSSAIEDKVCYGLYSMPFPTKYRPDPYDDTVSTGDKWFMGWYSKDGTVDGDWGTRIGFPYVYKESSEVTLYARFDTVRYENGTSFYFAYMFEDESEVITLTVGEDGSLSQEGIWSTYLYLNVVSKPQSDTYWLTVDIKDKDGKELQLEDYTTNLAVIDGYSLNMVNTYPLLGGGNYYLVLDFASLPEGCTIAFQMVSQQE